MTGNSATTRSVHHGPKGHHEVRVVKVDLMDHHVVTGLPEKMDLRMPDALAMEKDVNRETATVGLHAAVKTADRTAPANVAPANVKIVMVADRKVPKDLVVVRWAHRTRNALSKMPCGLMTTKMENSVVKN